MGVEDFLLGRNFLRSYQVLVDLISMKIVVRAPVKPVWHHAHAQVGYASLVTPVVLDCDLVLQPFERAVARAKLVTEALEPMIFQSVALNASLSDTSLHNVVFLEDSVATVSETGTLYVSLIHLTSNPQRVRCGVQLGTVVPVSLVYQAVPQNLGSSTTTSIYIYDFRPLNEVTIKDAYPLPRIDESLARLGKSKINTSIDLAWAFWQIPARKADRHKTTFACELGLFEWRRMPFGMCNASATFQPLRYTYR